MAAYDPFHPGYALDPYPALARLRAREPVHRGEQVRDWIVTGFEEAQRCLQDDEAFSNDPVHERGQLGATTAYLRKRVPLGTVPILGQADAPDHTRLRAVVNRAFVPRRVEALRPRIAALVDLLLDRAPADGPWELMRNLAEPLPVMVALETIGIPPAEHERVRAWSAAIMRPISGEELPAAAMEAAAQAHRAFVAYMEAYRRERPGAENVVGTLLEAEAAGTMTMDEAVMMVIHISLSGNGPTAFMVGNGVLALAAHPEQQVLLRADPDLIPNAVEEVLRWDSPTHHVVRIVREDTLLGKKRLRKGESVHVIIGAANRDPRRFPDPDRFDVRREDVRHLSFGHGIHFCLGAPVARLLGAIVFERLLERYGELRVVEGSVERGDTFLLRGPRKLQLARSPQG